MLQIVAYRGGMVYTDPPIHVPSISTLFNRHVDILSHLPETERLNIYYTVAHHSGVEGSPHPVRSAASFDHQTVLAFDIDAADPMKINGYCEAVCDVLSVSMEAPILVNSGNGVHIIFNLKSPIRKAEYFRLMKQAYGEICFKVGQNLLQMGLPGNCDPAIFEPARVLRLPGTINRKPGKEDKKCELVQYSDDLIDINLQEVSGLAAAEIENITPIEIVRAFPHPDFQEMVKECHFIKWAITELDKVHEPHAFDLFSLLANMNPGAKVTHNEKELSAKELAEYVFTGAVSSKSLVRTAFEDKWRNAGRYGCRKCDTINSHWGECSSCPHWGKIPTPLALKSPEHIGSTANGYWVINSKGQRSHPNYHDLSNLFVRERSCIVSGGERVMCHSNGTYKEIAPLLVKSWLEHKVKPADALRETHRNEFLSKVKAAAAVSQEDEEYLFDKAIVGKLNCSNGVLDILTGTLLPHAPTIGFKYVLPFAYTEDAVSEMFLDWLAEVTLDRTELMDSLLDVMAYCLWPSFDDHMFSFFVGEGANGKSTLLNILREILGSNNVSAISIQQLSKNRFFPALLEGKLANLSEESSGMEMDSDQLNVIKNLSAGGEIQAERKGKDGFLFRNKAKLIFSANRVPRFMEQGDAIRRRLVVIPFEHTIKNPDSNVEKKLLSEAPAILSMLIRRIRENTAKNNGKFLVSRQSATHDEARDKFLTTGNTVIEWAKECLESSVNVPDYHHVRVDDCYNRYRQWCADSGMRYPVNKIQFGKTMIQFVVTPSATGSDVKKDGGKAFRVYRRTRFIEDSNIEVL